MVFILNKCQQKKRLTGFEQTGKVRHKPPVQGKTVRTEEAELMVM